MSICMETIMCRLHHWATYSTSANTSGDINHHHHHQCSAQGQVLHCKRRNQGCSYAKGRPSTVKTQEPRLQFYQGWLGAVTFRTPLSFASEQILKVLILQPFRRFTYGTAHSPTFPLLHLSHSLFSNPSFASPTSQALHLIHLASRPWCRMIVL